MVCDSFKGFNTGIIYQTELDAALTTLHAPLAPRFFLLSAPLLPRHTDARVNNERILSSHRGHSLGFHFDPAVALGRCPFRPLRL
jgi:hypothetical protein